MLNINITTMRSVRLDIICPISGVNVTLNIIIHTICNFVIGECLVQFFFVIGWIQDWLLCVCEGSFKINKIINIRFNGSAGADKEDCQWRYAWLYKNWNWNLLNVVFAEHNVFDIHLRGVLFGSHPGRPNSSQQCYPQRRWDINTIIIIIIIFKPLDLPRLIWKNKSKQCKINK